MPRFPSAFAWPAYSSARPAALWGPHVGSPWPGRSRAADVLVDIKSPASFSRCRCPEPTIVEWTGLKFGGDRLGEGTSRGELGVRCPAQASSSEDFVA